MRKRFLMVGLALLTLAAVVTGGLVLRPTSPGPVVRTFTLASAPWAAALDEQTGHLFVVNRSFGGGGFIGGNAAGGGGSPGGGRTGNNALGGGFAGGASNSYIGGGTISILDTRGSTPVRTVPVGVDPRAAAVDSRHGLVYVTNDDEASMSVLDTRSGAFLRTTQVGSRPHALVVDAQVNRAFVVNTSDNTVSVLDTLRSKVLRVVHVPTAVDFSGAVVDSKTNRVFIVGGGSVSMLDARSGALLSTISLERDAFQRPGLEITQMAVDEKLGRVYALGTDYLSVLDAGTGRLLRDIPVSMNASALTVDARTGHVLIANTGARDSAGGVNGTGSLQVLDPGTGTMLKTISLGVTPSAVIVDQRAGHVIVVDSGGEHKVADLWGWIPDGLRKHLSFLPAPGQRTRTEPGSVAVLDLARL